MDLQRLLSGIWINADFIIGAVKDFLGQKQSKILI